MSEPAWFGRMAWLQIRVRGRVRDLKAIVVKPGADPTLRVAARANPGQPTILPRSAWGADEKLRKGRPVLAPRIRAIVIHHTATPNGYAADQVPSVIRALYLYQVRGNGLSDLGYNYLLDAQGRIYEGRYGGHRSQRRRRPYGRVQHWHGRCGADRQLHQRDAADEGAAGARLAARLAPRPGPRRSDDPA